MSLWIIKKRQSGGSDFLLFPGAEMLLPAIILLALLVTIGLVGGLMLFSLGFLLFLAAKMSQAVNGIYISWGSKAMSPIFRVFYPLRIWTDDSRFIGHSFQLKNAQLNRMFRHTCSWLKKETSSAP